MTSTNTERDENAESPAGRSSCTDLTGTWQNLLGSTMTLQHIEGSNKITGRYNTTVERKEGDAAISSNISGLVQPVEGGSLVAFNVLWNYGDSITAWVGQCISCDGQEKLYTTWALRSLETPSKRWQNTRINHDVFWRVDDGSQDTPLDTTVNVPTADILGEWKTVTGDSVEITQISDKGLMEGFHKVAGTQSGAPVYGSFDGDETYTAVGFVAANEQCIRGWAGHVYNSEDANRLEACWLSHSFSNLCDDPRKHVKCGMDNYSKGSASSE